MAQVEQGRWTAEYEGDFVVFLIDRDDPHLEPWRNSWRRVGKSDRTGIWHETFLVRAGESEAVSGNMRPVESPRRHPQASRSYGVMSRPG